MENTATAVKNKIEVKNLNFYYGKFHAIRNVNMSIQEKKVTAFIGPSGCGKSTLLRTCLLYTSLDLNGMTIVVDAAHGAAYNIAPHVFRELGAEVHAIGVHPDGFNINKGVGALHPEQLAKEVKARGAQLGIALDGDADRLQMVDGDGRIYNGDELLYAILRERMQRGKVDGVVGTLMTNFGFERALQRLNVGFELSLIHI